MDHIVEAVTEAYESATDIDEAPSQHGLRAAVNRALEIQREEIAQAIEGATGTGSFISRATAARIAREHSKEDA